MGLVPLVAVLLGLAAIGLRRQRREPRAISYALLFLVGLPLALGSRYIQIQFLLFCMLSAWGVEWILDRAGARFHTDQAGRRFAFLLLVPLLADCSLTLYQKSDHELPELDALREHTAEGRLVVLRKTASTLWRSLDVVCTGRATLFGGIPQCATTTYPYLFGICQEAAVELLDKRGDLGDTSRNAFRMLNVSQLLVQRGNRLIEFPHASPATYARHVKVANAEYQSLESIDWKTARRAYGTRSPELRHVGGIVQRMELAPQAPEARRLLLHADAAGPLPRESNDDGGNDFMTGFRILKWSESHRRFEMVCAAPQAGYVQLAYAHFPWLKANINGHTVRKHRSALGLIVLEIPAGQSQIVLEAGVSTLRLRLLGLAGLGLVLLLTTRLLRAVFLHRARGPNAGGV